MSYQITITNNNSKLQCNNTTDIRGVVIVQQDSVGGWQYDGFNDSSNAGDIRLRTAPNSYTVLTWEKALNNKIVWASDFGEGSTFSGDFLPLHASSSLSSLLDDTANWIGNTITLTGNNLAWALGQINQQLIIGDTWLTCITSSPGTTSTNGYAVWVRNPGSYMLDSANSHDADIITALEDPTGWDDVNNIKILSLKSVVGAEYTSFGLYFKCFQQSSGNYYWRRFGHLPATIDMQISDGNLRAELEAYNWTGNNKRKARTAIAAAERGQHGQIHYWIDGSNVSHKAILLLDKNTSNYYWQLEY